MGIYQFTRDGYAIEGTWGTSAIAAAGTQTYLFGVLGHEAAVHPSPTSEVLEAPTAVNTQEVAAGEVTKGYEDLTGMYPVGMQNGILLWAVMGSHAIAGADPYTHTITPAGVTAGVIDLLPSFTLQHERTGTATDWAVQSRGCKVAGLTLHCSEENKYLTARADWFAKSQVKVAFTSTADPVLPPTLNSSPYMFGNMTRTFDSVAMDGLIGMELFISPDMSKINTVSYTGGVLDRSPTALTEGTKKLYELRLKINPVSSVMHDESLITSNTKDIVFKWTRSANDYIQITCSDCTIPDYPLTSPAEGVTLTDAVILKPRAISIEVKDSIAGGHYGD